MGIAAPLGQRVQGLRFLKGAQVLPLDVFDERQFDDLVVVNVSNDDGQFLNAHLDRALIASFASDDFIFFADALTFPY